MWWPELNPACVVGLDALVTKEFSPKPLCHPHSTRYFSLRISLRIHHNGKSTAAESNRICISRISQICYLQCPCLLWAPFRGATARRSIWRRGRTYFRRQCPCSISGGLLRCANNALMDWIMSPSSGQAIIWRTIQDSNLKPIA